MPPRKTDKTDKTAVVPSRVMPSRATKRKATEDVIEPPPTKKVDKKTVTKAATKTAPTKATTKTTTKAAAAKAATTAKDAKAKAVTAKTAKAKAASTKAATAKATKTKAATTTKAATEKAETTKTATAKAATTKKATTTKAPAKSAPTAPATKKPAVKKTAKTTKAATATATTTANTTANTTNTAAPAAKTGTKRKATEDVSAAAPAPKVARVKKGPIINQAPTDKLDVFVWGGGSFGELGLGTGKGVTNVKRPRLNPLLSNDQVGVVQVAVGGMHCAALTHDNKILTWGVNDQGALGRDTTWAGGLRDMDADKDSDADSVDEEGGLNPRESTPTAIPTDAFPEGVTFVEVSCGDSNTFAVTDDGQVYGWGTFRSNEGILGFTEKTLVQRTPALIPELKKIKTVATGSNHCLALNNKGKVYAWGCGQQNQLGRRIVERTRTNGLKPRQIGVSRRPVASIACGDYHSFAVDGAGAVWSWGLNSYGQTGIRAGAGESEAIIAAPTKVESLARVGGGGVRAVGGAKEHSVAVTNDGDCLVWGRMDGHQLGLVVDDVPTESIIRDDGGRPRIVVVPTKVPSLSAAMATAGGDTSLLITPAGKAYSWGFSMDYQTAQGTDEEIEVPTLIDNTAVRNKVLNWGALGAQFGVMTGIRGSAAAAAAATTAE